MNEAEHLFVCLAEECAEVQKIVGKILRFGLDDMPTEDHETNSIKLIHEMNDIYAVLELLEEANIISIPKDQGKIEEKKKRVWRFMEYAKAHGTLTRPLKWIDRYGNKYTDYEIVYKDIDTPGAQFLGWVTKASSIKTNCIEDWIKVDPI